ncbi:zinc-dependent alcohol dehydrogenase family protein [Halomonas sp. MMSF_3323]|uniref:zinc-dependent alcohol dehydrogenase family protein n=1 Tax=Halomonas sp. MMSF_3323 TaxID=3046701 RepID=UPI00273F71D7|nr:zinc-dependent alcohol dehydrogenase family protein [Halomonas sp. MMSF_3323]
MSTSSMSAMVLNRYGEDAPFESATLSRPQVSAGQVVVRIAATSVNTIDTMIRQLGQEELPIAPDLPAVLGMDFAGTIEEVGEGVTGFAPGDEVYGCAGGLTDLQGSLAEYMLADARLIAHKPRSLSMRDAAALPLVAITAYEGLTRAGAGTGDKVLVHGGAGGVGHVAVQLARHLGCEVYATGSGEHQRELIEGFGATAIDFKTQSVDDYVNQHTDGAGFDVIFDSVGGPNLINSFNAVKLNGQVATTMSLAELDMTPAHFKGASLHVIFMLIPMIHNVGREVHGNILSTLAEIIDSGALTPLVDDNRFALADVGKAYAHLTSGKAVGKVAVDVES